MDDVDVDLAAGRASIGDHVLTVSAGAEGRVDVVGTAGTRERLRHLRFGERFRLTAGAASRPPADLAATIRAVAADGRVEVDLPAAAVEALALHLAGARTDSTAAGFAVTAATVSRRYGWTPSELAELDAVVADELELRSGTRGIDGGAGDGWTTLVLRAAAVENDRHWRTAASVRDRLAADLLRRAAEPLVPEAVPTVPWSAPDAPASARDPATPAPYRSPGARVATDARPDPTPAAPPLQEGQPTQSRWGALGEAHPGGVGGVGAPAPPAGPATPTGRPAAEAWVGVDDVRTYPAGMSGIAPQDLAPAPASHLGRPVPAPASSGTVVAAEVRDPWRIAPTPATAPKPGWRDPLPGGPTQLLPPPVPDDTAAAGLADAIAGLLSDEADLRGVRP